MLNIGGAGVSGVTGVTGAGGTGGGHHGNVVMNILFLSDKLLTLF